MHTLLQYSSNVLGSNSYILQGGGYVSRWFDWPGNVGWAGGSCGVDWVVEDIVLVDSGNPRSGGSHVGGLLVGVGSRSGCDLGMGMVLGCNCAA